jgi:hypothetical protein
MRERLGTSSSSVAAATCSRSARPHECRDGVPRSCDSSNTRSARRCTGQPWSRGTTARKRPCLPCGIWPGIEAFREQTASPTRAYLERATEVELNTPRRMISDPGHTSAPAGGCDRAGGDAHLQSPGTGAGDVPQPGETKRRDRPGLSGRLTPSRSARRRPAASRSAAMCLR